MLIIDLLGIVPIVDEGCVLAFELER